MDEQLPTSTYEHQGADLELVSAYRNGDDTAAGHLYELHYQSSLTQAINAAPNREQAEEFVSEAFTKVFEVIRRGSGPTENFRAYLRTTIRSIATEWYRDTANYISVDDVSELTQETVADPSLLDLGESEIVAAFLRLPERWKLALFLHDVEGRKTADCARELSINARAMSVLYGRAREGLRKEYLVELATVATRLSDAECRGYGTSLAQLAGGALTARRRRELEHHLAWCTQCQETFATLSTLAERFRLGPTSALVAVAGTLILPSLTAWKGAFVVPLLGQASLTMKPLGIAVGAVIIGTAGTAAVIAGTQETAAQDIVSVPVGSATCVVSLAPKYDEGVAGVFTASNSGAACTVSYLWNGQSMDDPLVFEDGHTFVATRPGTYTVILSSEEKTERVSFHLP